MAFWTARHVLWGSCSGVRCIPEGLADSKLSGTPLSSNPAVVTSEVNSPQHPLLGDG